MVKGASIGVLVSGGLDSDALLLDLAAQYRRVYPVYIRQGLVWERAELTCLQRFLARVQHPRIRPLRVLDCPMRDLYGVHWSTGGKKTPGSRSLDKAVYLPGRNLALSVKAAVYCALNNIPILALGSLNHNPFPDASPPFFKLWGQALGKGLGFPLRVVAPYRARSKAEVIRRGKQWPLHLSFSCIAPRGLRHCGRCNKCAERKKAFRAAGVKDLTKYENIEN